MASRPCFSNFSFSLFLEGGEQNGFTHHERTDTHLLAAAPLFLLLAILLLVFRFLRLLFAVLLLFSLLAVLLLLLLLATLVFFVVVHVSPVNVLRLCVYTPPRGTASKQAVVGTDSTAVGVLLWHCLEIPRVSESVALYVPAGCC